jgi:hypothetical protein
LKRSEISGLTSTRNPPKRKKTMDPKRSGPLAMRLNLNSSRRRNERGTSSTSTERTHMKNYSTKTKLKRRKIKPRSPFLIIHLVQAKSNHLKGQILMNA